jgi:putative lipoprotein
MKALLLSARSATFAVAGLALAASACSLVPQDPSFDSLSGSIVRADQVPLVPGNVVIVRLEDLSGNTGHANVIAEQRIERVAALPINFRLKFDGAEIVPEHRYAVTASVYAGGEKVYATDTSHSLITSGRPVRVQLILRRVEPPVVGDIDNE